MAVQASASQTIDGYNIIATYSASSGSIGYTVNKPDGSELFRAGSSFGLTAGFSNLARMAEEAGNTELANTYRSINSQASSVVPVLDKEVQDQLNAVQPPPPTEPVPPVTQNTPNTNAAGNSPANDDSKNDSKAASQIANQANLPTVTGSANLAVTNAYFASTTQAGSSNTTNSEPTKKNVGLDPKPGTRLKNPLGNFSSYTYQLSLYMITPDAHTAFVANGRKDINAFAKSGANSGSGGAYLILQSGGVNNTLNQRPPGMTYDYYIDDLRITNVVSTKQTATSSNITKITFNIVEPVGFSFTTKLKRAREALLKTSKIPNI